MHREIYRAIRSHNPAQARLTMEQHLNLARIAQASEADAIATQQAGSAAAPETEPTPAEPTTN
jgi:GntR family transcriptional repressor for pyruvate dehydrogenase complex